jgi:hypothetical protein
MSLIAVQGGATGTGVVTILAPVTSTNRTLTLPDNTGTVVSTASTAVVTPAMLTQPLTAGTAQASTSGTSIDFTGIPSWVKRVTVMFNGVSTSGTSIRQAQLGAGSVTITGYTSSGFGWTGGTNGSSSTTGIIFDGLPSVAATNYNAVMTINNFGNNTWVASSLIAATTGTVQQFMSTGAVTLSGTLDRVRITTVNGTDTFDAGSINILWE